MVRASAVAILGGVLLACGTAHAEEYSVPEPIPLELPEQNPHVIELGELPTGRTTCRPTKLPRYWTVFAYPEPPLPRGVRLKYRWTYRHELCFEVATFAPPTDSEEATYRTSVSYGQRYRFSNINAFPERDAVVRFSVRRQLSAGLLGPFLWFPPVLLLVALLLWRRRPRFDADLVAVWKIDVEGGYRVAGVSEWTLKPLVELAGARRRVFRKELVKLHKALDPEAKLDAVTLEPFPGEEMMVRCPSAMLLQQIGEPTARSATSEATLEPGTVVRVGRLLFVLLSPELAEAYRAGDLDLPEPGGGPSMAEERVSVVAGLRASLSGRMPGLWGWLALAFVPPTVAFLFTLLGLVTSTLWVYITSALVMFTTLAIVQRIRWTIAYRRRD